MSLLMGSTNAPLYDLQSTDGIHEAQFDILRKVVHFLLFRLEIYILDSSTPYPSTFNPPTPFPSALLTSANWSNLYHCDPLSSTRRICAVLDNLSGSFDIFWTTCEAHDFTLLRQCCTQLLGRPVRYLEKWYLFFDKLLAFLTFINSSLTSTSFTEFDTNLELRHILALFVASKALIHDLLHADVTTMPSRRLQYREYDEALQMKMDVLAIASQVVQQGWFEARTKSIVDMVNATDECQQGDFRALRDRHHVPLVAQDGLMDFGLSNLQAFAMAGNEHAASIDDEFMFPFDSQGLGNV